MKRLKLSSVFRMLLAAAATVSVSAIAAPIFSEAGAFNGAGRGAATAHAGAADAPLFSNMRLNGGQSHTVAFLGDDNSVLIGHYSRGPWSKSQFLRSWQNGGGGGDFLPPAETVTSLPEPSTLALLGLGLLAFGALKRRQAKR